MLDTLDSRDSGWSTPSSNSSRRREGGGDADGSSNRPYKTFARNGEGGGGGDSDGEFNRLVDELEGMLDRMLIGMDPGSKNKKPDDDSRDLLAADGLRLNFMLNSERLDNGSAKLGIICPHATVYPLLQLPADLIPLAAASSVPPSRPPPISPPPPPTPALTD